MNTPSDLGRIILPCRQYLAYMDSETSQKVTKAFTMPRLINGDLLAVQCLVDTIH